VTVLVKIGFESERSAGAVGRSACGVGARHGRSRSHSAVLRRCTLSQPAVVEVERSRKSPLNHGQFVWAVSHYGKE
jgi:hypothetical protein